MNDNKLKAKLQAENMQLAAKNTLLEHALKQKDNLLKKTIKEKDTILQHIISEKDAEIDRWKNLYLIVTHRPHVKIESFCSSNAQLSNNL